MRWTFMLLFLSIPLTAAAQDASVTLELRDGSRLVGRVVSENDREVRIATASGVEVTVARAEIVAPTRGDDEATGLDPNYSRLMFAPTGRPLRRGEGYFSDYELLFPGVAYGVTDHVTLAGGVSVVPGLGLGEQLFYVSPKIGTSFGPNVSVSVGGLYAAAGGDPDDSVGVGFGVATFGSRRRSLSAGLGFGHAAGAGTTPILMLGGTTTVARHAALVAETWIPFEDADAGEQPVGVAIRFFGDRLSADVGAVFIPSELDEGFPVPWLSVTYHFGL